MWGDYFELARFSNRPHQVQENDDNMSNQDYYKQSGYPPAGSPDYGGQQQGYYRKWMWSDDEDHPFRWHLHGT